MESYRFGFHGFLMAARPADEPILNLSYRMNEELETWAQFERNVMLHTVA